MNENEISRVVVDAAVVIHKRLGPGLLESVYQRVLAFELSRRGLAVAQQVPIKFEYEGLEFEEGFRADMVVNDLVLLELKSVEALASRYTRSNFSPISDYPAIGSDC